MAHAHDGGTMAAEAELLFIQIGLADARERERLLALGHESTYAPCAAMLPAVTVRTTDSSSVSSP